MKTSPFIRYCLVSDNDGHDYVVPIARRAEWNAMPPSELDDGVPEWATRIDGAHVLSFTDWCEGDGDVDTVYAKR